MPRFGAAALAALLVSPSVLAEPRFAEAPTVGLALPAGPLAGEFDATAVELNPAGLAQLHDPHLELVWDALPEDEVAGLGAGVGVFAGAPVSLPFLPRLGFGVAVQALDPPQATLAPDPGSPVKLGFALAWGSQSLAFGATWNHFFDDPSGALDGLNTFDLGVSARLGARLAAGARVRDLFEPVVADFPTERRWAVELAARPLGDDRFEIALGTEIGERRADVTPRLRLGVRLARGLYLRGDAVVHTRFELPEGAMAGPSERHLSGAASLGLEVSFGDVGVTGYASGAAGVGDDARVIGATTILRWSSERLPSILPQPDHLERIKLEGSMTERELAAVIFKMRRMERDSSLRGVFIVVDGVTDGWATLQEVREAMHRLRAKNKKVFAYIPAGTTRDYYLAAAADRVYLDASGGIRLVGMASTTIFFEDTFAKLGVKAQFQKIGEYKSAPEAFTRDASSPAARQMRESLLDDIYGRVVADLAKDRGLSEAQVKALIDKGPYTAGEAEKAPGLVDGVVEPSDVDRLVAQTLGGSVPLASPERERSSSWALPQVAVIYIEGDIVDGKSREIPLIGEKMAGGDTITSALTWARENGRVEAVVLRVNSPGGSALASEKIAREVEKLRGKKPIIISMGDLAASGGYFAAAPGDLILADPSTLTGSIGIFTGKFDLSGLLGKVGITWEVSKRGTHADMESYLRAYSPEEEAALQEKLGYFYGRFVDTVAKGRRLSKEQVDSLGRGRVWTGAQARERALVDRFGGLADAVIEAKRRAGLSEDEPAEIVQLPEEPAGLLGTLARLFSSMPPLPASLIEEPRTPQARLPYVLEIN